MADQLTRHQGDIPGRAHMAWSGQAVAVDEIGVFHPQFRRPLVHLSHKRLFCARQMFGQRHGAVVGRRHGHRFQHFFHRHLLIFLQVNLASPLAGSPSGGRHRLVQRNLAAVQRLHHQQHSHHFGDAGRLPRLIGVFFVEHLPVLVHQDSAGRHNAGQFGLCPGGRLFHSQPLSPGYRPAQNPGRRLLQRFFHIGPPLFLYVYCPAPGL